MFDRKTRVNRICPADVWRSFRADTSGVATLELGLLLPLFTLIILGLVDVARLAERAFQVQALAREGAMAVAVSPDIPADTGSPLPVIDVATRIGLPDTATASARIFRGCAHATGIDPVTSPWCPNGWLPAPYVEVSVVSIVPRLVPWPETLLPPLVQGKSVVRAG